ncbi:hypothetical protein H0H81_002298 [Sphagnurus paluster]|uniref:Phosphoglycerate mutase-like protein n=1 Tax=Sphagnurus paluster TaxID=117069 RepID=A0A9P7G255_9AGAR|nr:hypothetical protein H0H81_002298 [Sphagnurus paluster]
MQQITGFYQNPSTYTPSNTVLTPLGNQQEFLLGQKLRGLYLNETSPTYIQGINGTLVNDAQFRVRADAGGEGGVILNSALSLLQGLFPADANTKTTLANGTTITAPLGGYQYIPVESVEPDNDISLEGWTSCKTFTQDTAALYKSPEFLQMAKDNAEFLNALPPYLDGRPVTFENMWNVFDFMNVQSIHNAAFVKALPPTYLAQARQLANWHEYHVFSDSSPSGIGNIAGQAIIPSIIDGFNRITDSSNPVKFVYHAISYKPFISLFNMTKVAQSTPELAGIVNYAAAVALEARQPASGGEPFLRFKFQNGTDSEFITYPILGSSTDVPLSEFINYIEPFGINSLADWCSKCNNSQDRGCAALTLAATTAVADSRPKIGSVGAGFLGASLMLVLVLAMLGVLSFLGFLTIGGAGLKRKRSNSSQVFVL